MFCPKCGVKQREGSKFCHNCGTRVADNGLEKEINQEEVKSDNSVELPAKEPVVKAEDAVPKQEKKTTNVGLIMGIISVFSFFGIVFGILAILFGTKPEEKNKDAAKILGIVGIILGIFRIISFFLEILI